MSSKQSPAKVTLGMMKGKSITTSVPAIRYHASDDELEELYPSTDEETQLTPESEKTSPKCSPCKSAKGKSENRESSTERTLERRSASVDENLSEGTPPSDPWKVFSDIKGKITKTFEEKISEMKSDKKKHRHGRSRENSSISDSEDLGDITPTDENFSDIQERESSSRSPKVRRRNRASKFMGFSHMKLDRLKSKHSEEESVESGVEAAEFAEDFNRIDGFDDRNEGHQEMGSSGNGRTEFSQPLAFDIIPVKSRVQIDSKRVIAQLKSELYYCLIYKLIALPVFFWISYMLIPLPHYLLGCCMGIYLTITVHNAISQVKKILTTEPEWEKFSKSTVPVVEIPAVQEHSVIERFEGWLNELPYNYDPDNYHVARTKPVMFQLEGNTLRVLETKTRIPKRAIWDEPKQNAKFTKKKKYSLAGAEVQLLPEGLIRRRRWSKKYPICITFSVDVPFESISLKESSDEEVPVVDAEKNNEKPVIVIEEDESDDELSVSRDLKDVFEDCQDEDLLKRKMFVFARTDRQKEDWFRRLVAATNYGKKKSSVTSVNEVTVSNNSSVNQSVDETATTNSKNQNNSVVLTEVSPEFSYNSYMSRYVDIQTTPTLESMNSSTSIDVLWINALLGRILFDVHKCPDTINLIQDKIQRKLSNIKLPYFMESLMVSEVVIGQGAPVIHKVTKPILDDRGLWLDFDITHEGSLTMTVETKLNLMKLTRTSSVSCSTATNEVVGIEKPKLLRSPMFDSDVEDSPETSTEDEDNNLPATNSSRESTPSQSSGRKFLSMVDKLASNKYFQHATELSYIRRAMEGVSNTEIRLMVSVSSIEGCLSVNIPPSPADRLWYGFKPVPKINLTAKPALGERSVNIGYVTKWIETKLLREFEKIVVLPNMDDLILPLCPNFPY